MMIGRNAAVEDQRLGLAMATGIILHGPPPPHSSSSSAGPSIPVKDTDNNNNHNHDGDGIDIDSHRVDGSKNRLRGLYSQRRGAVTSLTSTLLPLFIALAVIQLLPMTTAIVYLKQMSHRVITTRYGKVRGILVEFPNRHLKPVEAYLGLRYADLERGNMRFMPPKNPKEQWNGVLAAVEQKPVCPQLTRHEREYQHVLPEGRAAHLRNITPFLTEQTEDCLTLNLYVPIPEEN
nr:hypothetical protein BaRGS_031765 [Batillaria attramentaria]